MKRRQVLVGAAKLGAALTAAPFIGRVQAQAGPTITVVGYGGSAADFNRQEIIPPFTKETGINVQMVAGPDLAKLKAQVQADRVEWDIYEAFGAQSSAGQKDGLWEPLDFKIIDPSRFNLKPRSYGVPLIISTQGIGFDPARSKNPPKTFAQMWDAKNFPGRLALGASANGMLEMALLADGVPSDKMYPLDVERAFKSLDHIKPRAKKWVYEIQQMITLIQSNEVDYSFAPTNRVKIANDSGVSIDCGFEQCIGGVDWYCVAKGSKNKAAAMKYLEYVTRPSVQGLLVNKHGLPSAVKGVEEYIDPKTRRWLVDFNNPKNLFIDDEYWVDQFVALDRRFKEWTMI